MIESYLKKIKFDFLLAILFLILCFGIGIYVLKDETLNFDIFEINFPSILFKNISRENQPINNVNARSIPVLLYHGIVEKPDGSNITLDSFESQMSLLKENGWNSISIDDFENFVEGKSNLPDKSFLITFDDGKKDSFKTDPILKALDFRAVIFVITGVTKTNNSFYLSENELKQMSKTGRWDFGSHTMIGHSFYKLDQDNKGGHFLSNKLWLNDKNRLETGQEYRDRIDSDLVNSKNYLEKIINKRVSAFAFPYGDYGQGSVNYPDSEKIISSDAKEIFPLLFYQEKAGEFSKFSYFNQNSFFYRRITVDPAWSAENILNIFNGYREKELPLHLDYGKFLINECLFDSCKIKKIILPNDIMGNWSVRYGNIMNHNGYIQLKSGINSEGGSIILNGAKTWENYQFSTTVDWVSGSNIGLIARFKDENNYLSCDISQGWWSIKNKIDGKEMILNEGEIKQEFSKENLTLSLNVRNNKIEFLVNGQFVGESFFDNSLNTGGIGFITWDKENHSELIIKKVNVY